MSRAGQLWTDEERDHLRQELNGGASIDDLVRLHGRTPYGIISQLMSMGVLIQGSDLHYYRVNPEPWALAKNVRALQKSVTTPDKEDGNGK